MMESNPSYYESVGLKVGLEVHQQLLTAHKMFCRCPAGLYTSDHDGELLRHMRPTLSELGEYDGTALMEFKTKKNILYLLHKSNVCTYEMDDTPPFPMNLHALDVAVEQCLMLGCDIVDEVHVARKQYLDGSIPTGFQRTAIVGVNGRLPFAGRSLSITQVSVEEDSCREVIDKGHLVAWRTDRLGMPLIETVTGPDLRTPEEVMEAILLIGRVCRSTGHVRVGMGASRQDINVSVRGGRRVEIKGVPQAWRARRLVHGEAVRQVNLLEFRGELHARGLKRAEDLPIEHQDITDMCRASRLPFLREENWALFVEQENRRPGLELGNGPFCVRAIRLAGLAGALNRSTQPNRTFAHELIGRVRVIAGLDQRPVLVHSEDWPVQDGSHEELERIRNHLCCGAEDSFVIVWGPLDDTVTAAREIRIRFEEALEGVPSETRQFCPDGTTDFERILPGPNRMYPDTDSVPTRMTRERVDRLRAALPPPPWVREERYHAVGVPRRTIHFLIRRNGAALVDHVVEKCGADLRRACFFFGERLKGLRRRGIDVDSIPQKAWCEFFSLLSRRPVLWEAWREIVTRMAAAPGMDIMLVVKQAGLDEVVPALESRLKRSVRYGLDHCNGNSEHKLLRCCMGQIMPELRGRVAAKEVRAALQERFQHHV